MIQAHCDFREKSGRSGCADRTGFFCRPRSTSAETFNCVSRRPCHTADVVLHSRTRPAQLAAWERCCNTTSATFCFSTTRLKRNHEVRGTLRTTRSGTPLRAMTINPKPPLCSSMSVALKACSSGGIFCRLRPQRTHNSREKSTPAFSAEAVSSESPASTSAQKYICEARASSECSTEVFPEDARLLPQISVRALRGIPEVIASTASIPVGMVSRSMRFDGTNAKGSLRSMVDRKIAAEVINSQGKCFAFSSLREYDCAAGKKGCQGEVRKKQIHLPSRMRHLITE